MKITQLFAAIAACAFSLTGNAQLTDWATKKDIEIKNGSSSARTNYTVLIEFDTETPIAAGEMNTNGDDIRVALDCDGSTVVPHFLESGLGTAKTKIWAHIPALPANGKDTLYLFYNNSTATNTSDFDAAFPNQLILETTDTLTGLRTDSVWEYNYIEVAADVIVKFDPTLLLPWKLRMDASKIVIAGTIDGTGMGFQGFVASDGEGPGGGKAASTTGGGGGAYGGAGGKGAYNTAATSAGDGGSVYGTDNGMDIQAGSGGGAPGTIGLMNPGGNGGILFDIQAIDISVTGKLLARGVPGLDNEALSAPGGGSGGGIKVLGDYVNITGTLNARGGSGGNSTVYYGGGGGGGGRVKIFHAASYANTGNIDVSGSRGGVGGPTAAAWGDDGTEHVEQLTDSLISSTVLISNLTLAASPGPYCENQDITFTAPTGATNYAFYINNNQVQDGPSNVFIGALNPGSNEVYAVVSTGGCPTETTPLSIDVEFSPNPSIEVVARDTGFCTGDSLFLEASTIPAGTNYSWELDGTPQANDIAEFYAKQAGAYTITATSSTGCSGTSPSIVVAEYALPVAELNLPDNEFCEGSSLVARLDNLNNNSAVWKEGPTVLSTEDTLLINTESVFNVQVTSPFGCLSNNVAFSTVENPVPSLAIISNTGEFICSEFANTILTATGDINNNLQWFFETNPLTGETTANLTAENAGDYYAIATSAEGCEGNSNTITLESFSAFNDIQSAGTELCEGNTLVLSGENASGVNFQWNFNGAPISGATDFLFNATAGGAYTLSYTHNAGCFYTTPTLTITQRPSPQGDISPGQDVSICREAFVPFTTTYTGSTRWFLVPNNELATGNNLNSNLEGRYYAQFTNEFGCSANSDTIEVSHLPFPNQPEITQNKDTLFTAAGSTSYQWYFEGNPIAGETDFFTVAQEDGNYSVVTFNTDGCGSDPSADYSYVEIGIGEVALNSFTLFPNPSSDFITIHATEDLELTITTLEGKQIATSRIQSGRSQSVLLPEAGVYFATLRNSQGVRETRKIIRY